MKSLQGLEERLHIRLFAAKDFENPKTRISVADTDAFGIVIDVEDPKNPILKLKSLFDSKSKLKRYKRLWECNGLYLTVFGVYPTIDKPLVIYPLGSTAEVYANNNILPFIDKNRLRGLVLSKLASLLKFNPSVGSLVIACYKTNSDLLQALFNGKVFLSSSRRSLLSLSATNNIYLIFGDSDQPSLAVHEVNDSEIQNRFETQNRLFGILGDLVAEPINTIKHNNRCYLIEKGLCGKPWFQLASRARGDWRQIKIRSLMALSHFQELVNLQTIWHRELNLANELKKQYLVSSQYSQLDTPKIKKCYDFFYSQLADIDNINSQFQHGDFCINNLLYEKERAHIIDFEDFGKTAVPLQDNFSLALSFFQMQGFVAYKDLVNEINLCLSNSRMPFDFSKEVVSALFFYHLMYRLGAWSDKEARSNYKKWVLAVLDEFLTNHTEFVSDLKCETNKKDRLGLSA